MSTHHVFHHSISVWIKLAEMHSARVLSGGNEWKFSTFSAPIATTMNTTPCAQQSCENQSHSGTWDVLYFWTQTDASITVQQQKFAGCGIYNFRHVIFDHYPCCDCWYLLISYTYTSLCIARWLIVYCYYALLFKHAMQRNVVGMQEGKVSSRAYTNTHARALALRNNVIRTHVHLRACVKPGRARGHSHAP